MAKKISDKLTFSFGWLALKLMGKSLYSNAWSAISELVANGFDANADTIWVHVNAINKKKTVIEIFDNGDGMTPADMRTYTQVGFDKRAEYRKRNKVTVAPSTIMGRKGIGKLAALYLSSHYYLLTRPRNGASSCWEMDFKKFSNGNKRPALKLCEEITDLCSASEWKRVPHGTLLRLDSVDLSGAGEKALEALGPKLANYFSLGTMNAKKILLAVQSAKNEKVEFKSVEKKVAFKNMSFIECSSENVGQLKHVKGKVQKIPYSRIDEYHKHRIDVEEWDSDKASGIYVGKDINGNEVKVPYKLTGWIGIHCTINKKDGALNDKDFMNSHFYNPSQLRLYVRNKLAMENFLNVLNSTATYANYIEGEIHFDLLDDDQLTDIATSNRQGVDEHDMRVSRLVEILAPIVRSLINKRTALAAQMKQEADKIRRSRESIAKENFSKEVGEDLASCRNLSPQERADLTTQIANKICGDVVVKTDRVVFFSHSSYDKPFGDFFFELLKSVGVDEDEMFYTSRDDNPNSYEDLRPLSEQIKSCMVQENTLLFYLIGHRYNRSQFCLFEGGAGWATRTTGNYPVLAIKYEHIPKFLTNGKNEMALYDFKRRSISLDKNNYQKIVLILNRIIEHINKGRQCRQKKTIPMFACVRFPNKVELRRAGKSEVDYMDKRILSFWESYVAPELKDYLRDMRKSCCS